MMYKTKKATIKFILTSESFRHCSTCSWTFLHTISFTCNFTSSWTVHYL